MNAYICHLAAATVLLVAATVRAEDEKMGAEAEARFREALAFAHQGRYEDARVKYLQVLALAPHAKVYLNLAIAEEASNRPAEALVHLKAYLASPNADPKKVEVLKREMYPILWKRTGHLQIKADAGSEIGVDGAVVGKAPLADTIDVTPGAHVALAGTKRVDIDVAAGEAKELDLSTPPARLPTASAEEPVATKEKPAAAPSPTRYFVAGGLGVASVASFVASGVLASASSAASDEAASLAGARACDQPSSSQCSAFNEKRDTANRDHTLSIVTLGAGVGLLGAAVATWFLWPRDGSSTNAWISPNVGPRSASLHAGLRF